MTEWRIPFNRASLTGRELAYVEQAVANGHISGDGPFTRRCEDALAEATGASRVMLTPSCTHALELAALLLDIGPEDEVIVPSFTFATSASAFALRGARIVFADVRPDTLNLDERGLEDLLTERTRAVVLVHYAGVACELDEIAAILRGRGIAVVEDAAHALFATYRGKPLGSFGELGALSFHETKNLTSGEGGALLVNDTGYAERAEILREKGTNRKQFFRGQVDKYTWVDLGSSYLLSDLGAAFLAAQLEHRDEVQDARRALWQRYAAELGGWAEEHDVRLPVVPDHTEQSWHMFHLLMPSLEARTALIEHLRARGILAVFHYLPLHLSDMGRRHGGHEGQCPVTEDVSDRLVRLPFYTAMTEAEQSEVIAALHDLAW